MRRAFGVCGVALLFACAAACNVEGTPNGQACYPGDYVYGDAAPDGARTYERCSDDGAAYVPYDGDPNAPPDAGDDAAVNCDPNAGKLTFMCIGCTTDDQCTTGRCFAFNNKGPHCTRACATNMDCPAPSGGCGNQGVCKPQ